MEYHKKSSCPDTVFRTTFECPDETRLEGQEDFENPGEKRYLLGA
jgi:hypothetical protein